MSNRFKLSLSLPSLRRCHSLLTPAFREAGHVFTRESFHNIVFLFQLQDDIIENY